MSSAALELFEAIQEKEARAADLRGQLQRSLLLQEIWPEAFKHGSVTSQAVGNFRNGNILFTIKNGIGESREMDLIDVPLELWPSQAIKDIGGRYSDNKYSRHLHKLTRGKTNGL